MASARRVHQARSEVRLTVAIDVSIRRYREAAQHLVMTDVSAAGALIAGDFEGLARGDEIILAIGPEISIVATIAWVSERTFGLAFHKRLHDFDFDTMLTIRSSSAAPFDAPSIYHASLN